MKILSLKLKNINSLSGAWSIDFTTRGFADDGIFAITGKTGAGKTSILDAVSLALYGKTPRVEKFTDKVNDVMTRNTNDCYSEIAFEIGGKIWKSSWKQERKRNGSLKPVNRQIADASNRIHADQLRSCDSKIVEILGLTFEQFTKVIMLAQGNFAAFLQADKNDKGELLEQITGTEIYGEISRKVFERSKLEYVKLERIEHEIEAIKILSEDEIETLNREIVQLIAEKKQIDADIQIIETSQKWLADIENLQKQTVEAKQKLSVLAQNVEFAGKMFEQSQETLNAAKTEKENCEKILVKVRELDTKIAEKDKLLAPINQIISELEKTKTTSTKTFEIQKEKLVEIQDILQKRQDWGLQNTRYELLTEQFAAIENLHLHNSNLLNDFSVKKNDFERAKTDLKSQISIFQNAINQFIEHEKALDAKERELKKKKEELAAILSGKETGALLEEKDKITKIGLQIKYLLEAEISIFENQNEKNRYSEFIAPSENLAKQLSKTISDNKTISEHVKNQIELLEQNIRFAKTIKSFDDHRKSLEKGKPCPLCGAVEHPFALGNTPVTDGQEAKLTNMKTQEKNIADAILQDEKKHAKLIADMNNALKNKEKADKDMSENIKKRDAILDIIKRLKFTELQNYNSDYLRHDHRINLLKEIQKQKRDAYRQIDAMLTKATDSEKLLKKLQDEEIPRLQDAKRAAEKTKSEALTRQKLMEQDLENKSKVAVEAEKKYSVKNSELMKIFAGYGVINIEALKKCLDNWNSNRKAIEDLKEKINGLEKSLALTNSEIANTQLQIDAKKTEKQGFETEKQSLSAERHNLFGDKGAEEEEKRVKDLFEKAERTKTEAEKSKINAVTEIEKNKAVITEKEKELTEKRNENITDKTLEQLRFEHALKKQQGDALSQKTGAHSQTLKFNEENLQINSKKLEQKLLQEQVCSKWRILNDLIGSLDGKKYRDFVQALTFEHLLDLANCQLQKMSERYILKRVGDTANPFELSVIDKFQNYEVRTAKNLSGGENFIVSLSLALGLASMASKNMKIDTMFIDEGFGTLDTDYLDIALSALSNLQNEGKLIGIISHLSELKERIATHIEIIPDGNGHSRIEVRG